MNNYLSLFIVVCGLSFFYLFEPCMVLLVEPPVLFLQFDGSQVLLVGPLVVVEHEEERVQVELGEIVPPVVHGHGGEHEVVDGADGHGVQGVLHFLVEGAWHVLVRVRLVGGFQETQDLLDLVGYGHRLVVVVQGLVLNLLGH